MSDEQLERRLLRRVTQAVHTHRLLEERMAQGQTPCASCSRLRRGILYSAAHRLGATKIALGHHREDTLETLLLNLVYTGKLQAMPARYTSDDGKGRSSPALKPTSRGTPRARVFPFFPARCVAHSPI